MSEYKYKKARQYTYHDFADKMKQPQAKQLVTSLQNFVDGHRLSDQPPEDLCNAIHTFVDRVYDAMKSHILWCDADEAECDNMFECLEKFIVSKLYSRIFGGISSKRNDALATKLAGLQFIEPRHLDLHGLTPDFLQEEAPRLALTELENIDRFKSAKDKLVCLMNCSRILMNILSTKRDTSRFVDEQPSSHHISSTVSATPLSSPPPPQSGPSADDFLPLLIYLIIRAQPNNLYKNMEYMEMARNSSKFKAEPAYFHTHLRSAVTFIEQLTHSQLSGIDKETYTSLYNEQLALQQQIASPLHIPTSPTALTPSQTQSPVHPTTIMHRTKSEPHTPLLSQPPANRSALELPFLHASADSLRVCDVYALLAEYQRLAEFVKEHELIDEYLSNH